MRITFKISVLVNIVLLAGLIWFLMDPSGKVFAWLRSAAEKPTTPKVVADTAKSFRWNQLNASDYHVYVKNLRHIGCPEPTVRAIVTADVHAALWTRLKVLEQNLAATVGTNPVEVAGAEATLKSETEQIPAKEEAMIRDFLGLKPDPAQDNVATTAPKVSHRPPWSDVVPALPMVFEKADLIAGELSQDQRQVITTLRDIFVKEIGGTNQNPNDPAYLARWQKAQVETDSLLEGMLGDDDFMKFQALVEKQNSPTTSP